MYGMIPKKRGLFGNPGAPVPVDPQMSAAQPQMAPPAQPAKKGGFMSPDGAGQYVFGAIADTLSRQMGYQPTAIAGINSANQQRQELAEKQRQASLDRQAGLEDYKTKAEIDAQYAAPKDPYRWRNNNGDLMEMGPEGPRVAYDDPKDKTEWIRTVDPLTGAITMMPSPGGFGGGAPASPVGKLTPLAEEDGAGNGPGNFPR